MAEPGEEAKPQRRRRRRNPPPAAARPDDPLGRAELYFNRELSLLEFQRRVLAQAQDARLPLLERLRFLTICSANLDEFYEIRVAGLKQQIEFGLEQPSVDGRTPTQALEAIGAVARDLVREQYRVLHEDLLPALEAQGVRLLWPPQWNAAQRAWAERYFRAEVLPVLTPVALDPAHPFPRVQNKSLNFVVRVSGADAFGRDLQLAVVQVPRSLPRVIAMPRSVCGEWSGFALLSALVQAHMPLVLPGLEIEGSYAFRVTRNSDIEVDEEEVDNLLKALAGQLSRRRFLFPVRLEVADDTPAELEQYLLDNFELDAEDLFRVRSPVNLHRLAALVDLVPRTDLKFRAFVPGEPADLAEGEDLFGAIRRKPHLLHHPYESFSPVVRLLEQAAADPAVLAVKMTLYRVGADSPVVAALARAARARKEVTAVVELRARFDEEANIGLANLLQEAGANVVYGVVGYKTHAKMTLVVRREHGRLRRYAHLGTGNYHHATARVYGDLGLLTADPEICEDVHDLFLQLTGLGRAPLLHKLVPSPTRLYRQLIDWIDFEAAEARAGRPGAHDREDQQPVRPGHHPGDLPGVAGRCAGRSDRARHLPAAPGGARRQRERARAQPGRALPRARARVLVSSRRAAAAVLEQRRLDGAQSAQPRRGGVPGRSPGAREAHPRGVARRAARGHGAGLDAALRRLLRARRGRQVVEPFGARNAAREARPRQPRLKRLNCSGARSRRPSSRGPPPRGRRPSTGVRPSTCAAAEA
jgi:polyphosphate kinase